MSRILDFVSIYLLPCSDFGEDITEPRANTGTHAAAAKGWWQTFKEWFDKNWWMTIPAVVLAIIAAPAALPRRER
ncbi:hypothetical protein ES703_108011 [subsurface metagenome]